MIKIIELTDKEKQLNPEMEFEVIINENKNKFTREDLFELYKKTFQALNK